MATSTIESETEDCIFQWKIENTCSCWHRKFPKRIRSETFIVDALFGTKWSLSLYPAGLADNNYVGVFLKREKDCCGPDVIEVNFKLALLGKNGTTLRETMESKNIFSKDESWGYSKFESRKRVFFPVKVTHFPEDSLTLQCTFKIGEKLINSKYLYGRTSLETNRKSFMWRMGDFSTIEPGVRKKFKNTLFEFDFILNEDFNRMCIDIIEFDDFVHYIWIHTYVVNLEGEKEDFGSKSYYYSEMKKGILLPVVHFPKKITEHKIRCLPNDTLSLVFDFTLSYVECFDGEGKSVRSGNDVKMDKCNEIAEQFRNSTILINDLKSMYIDGIFSDTELRTFTKSFPVHKGILSARSPVFKRMFSNDMKEVNSGHVDIADFEDDTVQRMLLYIYTGALQDLQMDAASELYKIANKYEIMSLQNECSDYLRDNLCTTQVCDVFILADLVQDKDLKCAALAYIMDHNEVFQSVEWENFMESNIKLAADIMYMKLNTDKILKRKL